MAQVFVYALVSTDAKFRGEAAPVLYLMDSKDFEMWQHSSDDPRMRADHNPRDHGLWARAGLPEFFHPVSFI